jgi:hypothetical protein
MLVSEGVHHHSAFNIINDGCGVVAVCNCATEIEFAEEPPAIQSSIRKFVSVEASLANWQFTQDERKYLKLIHEIPYEREIREKEMPKVYCRKQPETTPKKETPKTEFAKLRAEFQKMRRQKLRENDLKWRKHYRSPWG